MANTPSGISFWWLIAPLLFAAALVSALFFQGFYTEFFSLSLALLIFWLGLVIWQGYQSSLRIPKTAVALCLILMWLWHGMSIGWGRVAYISVIDFWWVGSLPLVFWIYTLSPEKEITWRFAFASAAAAGVMLALAAVYQFMVQGAEPTAVFLNKNSLAAQLNLVAIPLCAYFLRDYGDSRKWRAWLFGIGVFVLFFAVAIIKGRGAILSGFFSLALLFWLVFKYVPKKSLALLTVIIFGAFLAASMSGRLDLSARISTVLDPWNAGSPRTIIWRQAWEMIKESPWLGWGPGHFPLYWPPFRHPDDSSAGYYIHNDYLQAWVEAGLPGLVLLLAMFIAVVIFFVRAARRPRTPVSKKIEMAGLFCGLFATALHSFVDFNLHILSILIVAGLMLGRLHALAAHVLKPDYFIISPQKFVGANAYRAITTLLLAFPLFYFITLGLASYKYQGALALAEAGELQAAHVTFTDAMRLFPNADNVQMSDADLLRHLLAALPQASHIEKKALYTEAVRLLDNAEALNPLRPQTYTVRARLYLQNPQLAGEDWAERAIQAYQKTLQLNPRIYQARYMYAELLLTLGRIEDAHRILEEGMRYWYVESVDVVPYYALTVKLRRKVGDLEGAERLQTKVIESLQRTTRPGAPSAEKVSPVEVKNAS